MNAENNAIEKNDGEINVPEAGSSGFNVYLRNHCPLDDELIKANQKFQIFIVAIWFLKIVAICAGETFEVKLMKSLLVVFTAFNESQSQCGTNVKLNRD